MPTRKDVSTVSPTAALGIKPGIRDPGTRKETRKEGRKGGRKGDRRQKRGQAGFSGFPKLNPKLKK